MDIQEQFSLLAEIVDQEFEAMYDDTESTSSDDNDLAYGDVEHEQEQAVAGRQEVEGDCVICQESLKQLVWCRNGCGTNLHQTCATQWLETGNATCPVCRAEWD